MKILLFLMWFLIPGHPFIKKKKELSFGNFQIFKVQAGTISRQVITEKIQNSFHNKGLFNFECSQNKRRRTVYSS